MKKLLFATMSAAAVSLAGLADFTSPTGTSFEDLTFNEGTKYASFKVDEDDAGSSAGTKYWSVETETESVGYITNRTDLGEISADYGKPEIAATLTSNEKCLFVDTDTRLSRSIAGEQNGDRTPSVAVGDGLYFDSLVQFTATDTAPTPASGDKLIVWLYGSEDEIASDENPNGSLYGPGTKLVVTAGYFDNENGGVVSANYVITTDEDGKALEIEPNSWHRLTISAIASIGTSTSEYAMGFVVRIDGKVAKCADAKGNGDKPYGFIGSLNDACTKFDTAGTLFPSMVLYQSGTTATLSAVALEGTGAIDDITFTTTNPYPETVEDPFTLTVTVDQSALGDDDKIESYGVFYIVGEATDDNQPEEIENSKLEIAASTVSTESPLKVVVKEVDSAKYVVAESNGEVFTKVKNEDDSTEEAVVYDWVYTVPTEFVTAGGSLSLTIKITLVDQGGGDASETPSINGVSYESSNAFVAAFKSGLSVTLPNGWSYNSDSRTFSNGTTTYGPVSDYYNYDTASGAITFNESVVQASLALGETTDETTEETTEPITIGADKVALNLPATKVGLYYAVAKLPGVGTTTITKEMLTEWQEGTGGQLTLDVIRGESETDAFYKIVANDKQDL